MENIFDSLKPTFKGDVDYSDAILASRSKDASLFEIRPQVVVFPKDSEDVKTLVRWVNEHHKNDPTLSITPRAAGTDMSGGVLGPSIVIDLTRYMNTVKEVTDEYAVVEPGCYYRDFEKETLKRNRIMPTYPASREICAVGGMVGNNSGGEKSIRYGKTADHIKAFKVVFIDGNEYEIRPLSEQELLEKTTTPGLEGKLYKKLYDLILANYETITRARPVVSKNSSGYYLWDVYDKEKKTFDLCRLISGSQGTLGIITEITFELFPVEKYSNMLVAFLPTLDHLSEMIDEILPFHPDSLESYDDYSMKLAVKFFFDFFKVLGFWKALKLGFQFIPDAWTVLLSGRVPKLILMAEFTGPTKEEVEATLARLEERLVHFNYKTHIAKSIGEAQKYWRIRRESFNLLRKHVHGKKAATFIEDIIVKPEYLREFLPKLQELLDDHGLIYTLQGHPGNGNFHIFPLMNLNDPTSVNTIIELSDKVYDLVHAYKGSISAEHNDGIIRTPYLLQMFGPQMCRLFKETKELFDPENILNPRKKVDGTVDDIKKYLSRTKTAA